MHRDIQPLDPIELEKQIDSQNKEYFKIYDDIAKNLSQADRIKILTDNKQMVPDTDEQVS